MIKSPSTVIIPPEVPLSALGCRTTHLSWAMTSWTASGESFPCHVFNWESWYKNVVGLSGECFPMRKELQETRIQQRLAALLRSEGLASTAAPLENKRYERQVADRYSKETRSQSRSRVKLASREFSIIPKMPRLVSRAPLVILLDSYHGLIHRAH